MNRNVNNKTWWAVGIIFFAAFSRLIPHLPNFTPLLAVALFGGAYLTNRSAAVFIPLAAMFISDVVMHFTSGTDIFNGMTAVVYSTLVLIVLIGALMKNGFSSYSIFGYSTMSTILFFITSNLMVWLVDGIYPMDFSGLIACYIAAIPFAGNMLAGTIIYSTILFYGFEFLKIKVLEKVS